ncbi:MAG: BrnT family toxin [bacterium]|nr:BrnT family toxin [bacterium]
MLFIRKLIWDTWNIQHITRHDIAPEEVEEICHNLPLVLRGQQKGRLVLIGLTEGNRMIAVVLEVKEYGKYYPVTAYEPDVSDKALYNRLRGGENNEEENK